MAGTLRGAIHDITILNRAFSHPDAGGRFGDATVSSSSVRGRVLFRESREQDAVGRFGEDLDFICVMPIGTAIAPHDQVSFDVDASASGTFEVEAVDYLQAHLEVRVRRRAVD